jgi:pimeloyl-ACP methyl ester carboxylesterase
LHAGDTECPTTVDAAGDRLDNGMAWIEKEEEMTFANQQPLSCRDFWLCCLPASHSCIKAFSETDLTADLGRFDIPTFVLHGDDDQIVPIGASAMLSSKLIKDATLKIYKGAPHGMCTTLKDQVNAELLAFLRR